MPVASTRAGLTHYQVMRKIGRTHANGRVYDPALGRFLSVDPVFQAPTNAQSLNPYSYVMNNPLSLVDPSGYSTCSPAGSGTNNGAACQQVSLSPMTGSNIKGVNTGASCSGNCTGFLLNAVSGAINKAVNTIKNEFGSIGVDKYMGAIQQTANHMIAGIEGSGNGSNGLNDVDKPGTNPTDTHAPSVTNVSANSGTGSPCAAQTVCLGKIEVHASRPLAFKPRDAAFTGIDFGLGAVVYTRVGKAWMGMRNLAFYGPAHGANGGTGSKLKFGILAEDASRGLFYGEAAYAGFEYVQDMKSGDYAGALDKSTDVLVGGIAADTGIPGWIGGGVYFGVKDTVGWGPAMQAYGNVTQQYSASPFGAQPPPIMGP